MKTAKFGGSSLADAKHFEMVKEIVLSDEARKVVVVSAPGKRFADDNKVTDLLYLCGAHLKYGVDHTPVLSMIEARYQEIVEALSLSLDVRAEFLEIEEKLKEKHSENYLISRGEYLCAKALADFLGFDFIDAKDVVTIRFDGSIDSEKTYQNMREAFAETSGRVVVPGFYGSLPNGAYALMTRSGSDITGALMAAALDCTVYENWTDVPGILMADPRIVENPRPIPCITYSELRGLTYMGANVLHEDSLRPVKKKGIPINIRDTAHPEKNGTLIQESFEEITNDPAFITGLAGKKNYVNIVISKNRIFARLDIMRRFLEIFEKHGIPVALMTASIDGFSFMVENDAIEANIYAIVEELELFCGKGSVSMTEGLALIAVVGRQMAYRPGVSGILFGTLGKNNINIRLISQGSEEIAIMIAVEEADFERAIQVLYDSFTRKENGV